MRAISLLFPLLLWAGLAAGQEQQPRNALADAFAEISRGNWQNALQLVETENQVAKDIVQWHRLRAGVGSLGEYHAFITRNPDWPGLPLMHRKGEAKISADTPTADVIAYFENQRPRTGNGAFWLAAAYAAMGKNGDAAAEIVLAWRRLGLSQSEFTAYSTKYPELLAPHHTARLDMLLWRGRFTDAQRMFDLVGPDWQALAEARIALRRSAKNVDSLIAAVPEQLQSDPGLAYERFLWRLRKGRTESAIALLLAQSKSAQTLGEPLRWANQRRALARQMMRAGDGALAYRIASSHHLGEGSDYADLEWLSGYLALRYLQDPKAALAHFHSFRVAVKTPISLGRAAYWEGRAYEAMNDTESARASYAYGAEYQTSFYGLLAAERAGLPMDAALTGSETFPDWRKARFMSSSVLYAALILHQSGQSALSKRFFLQVAETLNRVELGQLADLAFFLDEPHLALMIAKQGAKRQLVLHRAYYPLHDLAREKLPVLPELALAIARRESEFNPLVQSGVGAKGLMQLMPKTAKSVAEDLGLDYDKARLLSDWHYNAQLGSRYLADLRNEFGPSPILISVGYNAGPSRVRSWVSRFGDPRSAGVDVVDWIEHIPFRETRNYVMRVSESLPIYRARLSGKTPPLSLSKELRTGH
ncbi:MAG: hypothetical protein CSA68_08875 [Rhodobacterales bacterium]|nr:MAG: hypothetical protein CSA68_08875 [Rhodobacterales bacterium]